MFRKKIIIWWGSQSGMEKWHVEVLRKIDEGQYQFLQGSGSSDFPEPVEQFGPLEEDTLIQSLKATFPDADIRIRF
ncbi:MAG: hypothetical protein HGB22_07080 [Chlorobiaceae bacterium]|nr:hypothetical protein [Chlorobiaceae bacterium]